MKEGWERKALGDIATVKGGKRIPKGEKLVSEPTGYPYIRVSNFNDQGSVDLDDIQYVTEDVYDQINKYTITDEDLYISIAGTIGKSGIIPSELNGANLTENACKLIFNDEVLNRYVLYFTHSEAFLNQAGLNTRTTAMPKLALKRLKTIELNIPPYQEQKRIVAILDEAFEAIDEVKTNVERNIDNAKELFQSKLNEIFSQRVVEWKEKKLGEVYNFKNGLNFTKDEKNEVDGKGILTIDVYNMYRGGLTVDLSELYRVDKVVKESYLLKKGDILFVRSSLKKEGVAWTTYFTEHDEDVSYCGFIIRGRPKRDLNPEYSVYYCRSPRVRNELINRSVQSTITNINQRLLSDVDIPIPDRVRQAEIVEELKLFESQKNELISNYEKRLDDLAELKKSILQKAFSGELTANETVAV